MQSHRLGPFVWSKRVVDALEQRVAGYSIFRELRFAARVELGVLFDAIALDGAWRVHRVGANEALIDGDGLWVFAWGNRKADYCSVLFYIYATDVARAEEAKARLLAEVGSVRIREPMFSIDWHFRTSGGLESADIEEIADAPLFDAAYPAIPGGVAAFIEKYLDAPEAVLVLQGPPGTGKTRLIRAILAAISRRKGEPSRALYTGDTKAMETDEIFVKFITGDHDAFVVEDADHMM